LFNFFLDPYLFSVHFKKMVARAKSGSPPIKIMKKSEIQSSSNFVEENAFGENLQIGCFDDTFKFIFN